VLDVRAPQVTRLLEPGPDGRIGCARTMGAPVSLTTEAAVAWVLVERGDGVFTDSGGGVTEFEGRADVFNAPGWCAFVGPGSRLSVDGGADLALTTVWCAARAGDNSGVEPLDPATFADEERGSGTTARRVRTYRSAGSLIVGETLNPPGGWSSWPPHSHAHEEIYLYRFDPPHGFGVHVDLADGTGRGPSVVRDGDIVRIVDGQHPVVAAPGCAMYYLWALVGDTDEVDTRVDTRYAT
jgi:5-deoxy-glucuronate isomerase